ncbi:photosystem II reaction center PSB28 protein, chloroplastic-like [Cucurbita pepo subsp. pepo]|uniref:photosystem II reaction center PSB28 protein, chloroplastic-like n=1 Tax=Cucurbita pepo subsp. pepo TaxID=3664 RepID=UPI000C9D4933|nr:photosystem II reaction center PSB28 protein, chloroplastic-like [Cucurbita pepo subsp. pepo]
MATLQSLASTPHLHHPSSTKVFASATLHRSAFSAFYGRSLSVSGGKCQTLGRRRFEAHGRPRNPIVMMMVRPKIQFIQGTDEQTVPDVRLTKSRDGTNGMAIFKFDEPSVFDSSAEVGDITGFYMIDEEGVIQSVDVNAKFINGKPAGIEAKYVMRTPREWDRFMRFMERYSNANGLQFVKK